MKYVIMTGKFETGDIEKQQGYMALFGSDDIQYFFDLYFHWYNIIHETGHCLVEKYNAKMSGVDEEMYVNSFAVAYYRYIGDTKRLSELQERLKRILGNIPAPMPEGESFTEFYERIWNTEQLNNVMIYGYFQLNSVLEALNNEERLNDVLKKIGIDMIDLSSKTICNAQISSENTELFFGKAREDLMTMGINVPEIRIELVDDPMIQCARPE